MRVLGLIRHLFCICCDNVMLLSFILLLWNFRLTDVCSDLYPGHESTWQRQIILLLCCWSCLTVFFFNIYFIFIWKIKLQGEGEAERKGSSIRQFTPQRAAADAHSSQGWPVHSQEAGALSKSPMRSQGPKLLAILCCPPGRWQGAGWEGRQHPSGWCLAAAPLRFVLCAH